MCVWGGGPSEGECTNRKTIAPRTPWTGSGVFTGLILIDDFWKYKGAQLWDVFFTVTELRPPDREVHHHFTRSFAIHLQEW